MRSMLRSALCALTMVCAVGAVSTASALAASAPTVETKPATNITATGATLNGSVNPNGAETKYYFEYENPLTKTAEAGAGSGTTSVEESKAVTGLTPSRAYLFRIVATNSAGTTDGSWKTFSTPAETPEFSTAPGKVTGTVGGVDFWGAGNEWNYTSGTLADESTSLTGLSGVTLTLNETGEDGCYNVSKTHSYTTGGLKARLGYLNKAKKEAGLMFEPATEPWSGACERFMGQIENVHFKGVLTGQITPVNTSTKKFTVKIATEVTGGKRLQDDLFFEGEKESTKVFPLELEEYGALGKTVVETHELTLETEKLTEIKAQ